MYAFLTSDYCNIFKTRVQTSKRLDKDNTNEERVHSYSSRMLRKNRNIPTLL